MILEPGKIACHLEGSRASSLVTRYGSAARVGAGNISFDLIGDRPMLHPVYTGVATALR